MNKKLTLDSRIKLNISPWDFYGFVLLACVVLLLIPKWYKLPLFMDCYYHLSVMRGFADAGGWVHEAFWEFAPVGRPQLYPPFFHLLELAFFRAGLGPIDIARIFDFTIYPVFLFCIWWPMRALTEKRTAFFALLLLASSYPLYLGVINNIPFTLAMIFSYAAYSFHRKGKTLAAAAALVFAFYSHTLMSLIGAAAFLGACFFLPRQARLRGLWALGGAILGAAPLFVFQAARLKYFNPGNAMEFYFADINIVLCCLAFLGLIVFSRKKGADKYPVALLAAMAVLLLTNRDRFLSGIGLVPLSLFGAMALDDIWCRIRTRGIQIWHGLFWGVFTAALFLTTPMVRFSPLEPKPRLACESTIAALTGLKTYENVKSQSLYHPKLYSEIVRIVDERSLPDDILFSNIEYGGGIVAVLAHRATSFAMLREVKPHASFDPVAAARFIVWFKNEQGIYPPVLKEAVDQYQLRKTGETELVYLYENPAPRAHRGVVAADIPERACFVLIGFLALVLLGDLMWKRKDEKKVDTATLM